MAESTPSKTEENVQLPATERKKRNQQPKMKRLTSYQSWARYMKSSREIPIFLHLFKIVLTYMKEPKTARIQDAAMMLLIVINLMCIDIRLKID